MPSLFKQSSFAVLQERRDQVNREIASLERFRDKIDRRIAHVQARANAKVGEQIGPTMEAWDRACEAARTSIPETGA